MARLRTFIAVDLGPAIRERCQALQTTLARAGTEVKWVEQENLHVTLLFLGEVDERDVTPVCQAVSTVCAAQPAITLSVGTVGCFPNPRRPRVVWVGVGEGAAELVALHDAIERPLLKLGCYRREERKYTPHITLGRVRGNEPPAGLAAALTKQADWQAGSIDVHELLILSSELTPRGPIYSVLSRARMANL